MTQQHQQNHATWECKYHVVFIPKYRKKAIFGVIKKRLGDVFHELARRRESKIEEGHLMPDHVHMLISIPPKSVAEVIGFMKASLPQRIHLPLQQAVLSVQRLPFPARHRGRRHRTDLRRALLRSLAASYMSGVWVTTG